MSTESDRQDFERTADHFDRIRAAPLKPAIAKAAVRLPDLDSVTFAEDPDWCPDCHDTGYRVSDDGGAGDATRCDCKIPHYDGPESIPAADLESYGCARSVASCLKSTWDQRRGKWPQSADIWPGGYDKIDGKRPRWLFIHGVVGNGKSRVAAWIMRRAMAKGTTCWWLDVPAAIEEARAVIGNDQAQKTFETKMVARLSRQLVILDDVAAGRGDSAYQVEDLFASWVRTRHESGGWTVATSNLTLEKLRDFHAPSASRIVSGKVTELTGGDARRREWKAR